jgi:ELWxxDGT repeat protein
LLSQAPVLLGSPGYNLTNVSGTLFFVSSLSSQFSTELYVSDGTSAGTTLVKDINPNGSAHANSLTNFNGTLFFSADDGSHGYQIWRSDGTSSGTLMVTDINPGPPSSGDGLPGAIGVTPNLTNVNGTLFFIAPDLQHSVGKYSSWDLWRSDGTSAGTKMIGNVYPGFPPQGAFFGSFKGPSVFTNVNGTLFFDSNDGSHGFELWKSDGTSNGTAPIAVPSAIGEFGQSYLNPHQMTNFNGTLFFIGMDNTTNFHQLWRSDGTSAGTVRVSNIPHAPSSDPTPIQLTNVNGTLFFGANDGTGNGLWRSDGTSAGTVLLKDFSSGLPPIDQLTNVNGTLFFRAGSNETQLWMSDGTTAGTVLVPNIALEGYPPPGSGGYPTDFANVAGTLFFAGNDGSHGYELFQTNGTSTGTTLVADIDVGSDGSFPRQLTNINGILFFNAEPQIADMKLWALPVAPVPTVTVTATITTDSSGNFHGNIHGTVTSTTGPVNEGQVVFTVGGQTVTADVSNGTFSTSVVLPPSTDLSKLSASAQYVDPSNPSGPPNFSNGNPVTVSFIPVSPTTTTVANGSVTASGAAQQVAVTATVTSSGGTVNEGTVTFTLGNLTVSAPVTSGTASANLSLPAGFPPGSYSVAASYADTGSSPKFDSSGDMVSTATAGTLTVMPAGTTTTVTNTSVAANGSAQQVAVTATVTSSDGTVNEGTVTFTLGSLTASAPVINGAASTSLSLPAGFPPGNYSVAATYADPASNPKFASSGGPSSSTTPGTLSVTLPSTTTTVANASVTANGAAQQVAVTATVTSSDGTVNEGTVTFTLGNQTVSAPVVNGSASATLSLPAGSPPGNYSVSASYADTGSNPKFTSSSGPFSSTTPGTLTVTPPLANTPTPTPTPTTTPTPTPTSTPPPASTPSPSPPPSLHKPSLLALFDQLLGGVETVGNGVEVVTDSIGGISLVSTYNAAGNLVSVTIFGINITFLFLL